MRFPQITGLRFVAALSVVLFHYADRTFEVVWPWLDGVIAEGALAVAFFFFLSGAVLGIRYPGGTFDARGFWLRRAARIMPLYLIALCAALLLQVVYFGDAPYGAAILAQALAVHAWWPPWCLAINYPGWSISVELFLYGLYPFLALGYARLGMKRGGVALVLLWLVSIFLHAYLRVEPDLSSAFILYFPLWHVGSFAAGILCAAIVRALKERSVEVQFPLVALSLVLFVMFFALPNPMVELAHNGGAAPAFFVLLCALCLHTGTLAAILSWRPFQVLGNASYAMYLFQFPVYMVFTGGRRSGSLELQDLLFYLILLLAVALICERFLARPMRGWLVNKLGFSQQDPVLNAPSHDEHH